jgi:ubiquinone/menaquinone biosynthesis C-methylase UbiE
MSERDQVREYFERHSEEEWDRLNATLAGRIKYRIHREMLDRHLPESGLILDAGCGPGRYALGLIRHGFKVVLADFSASQLALAEKKIREAGLWAGVEGVHEVDIADLSIFADSTFDSVICFGGALSYLRLDAPRALREFVRVARSGATVFSGVMSLYGTMKYGAYLDLDEAFATLGDHLDWVPGTPLPEVVHTRPESNEFHAPMTLYTAKAFRHLLQAAGLQVMETAAANPLWITQGGLKKMVKNDDAARTYADIEVAAATRPELADSGAHVIAAARKP